MDESTEQQKTEINEQDTAKIKWIIQLFGFVKTLQKEVEERERNKRYFSIFVSGCITYFIVNILQQLLQTESDFVVFVGALICLCLHYIIDNVSYAWNQAINLRKFQKTLMSLEKERIELGITEEDISFDNDDEEGWNKLMKIAKFIVKVDLK